MLSEWELLLRLVLSCVLGGIIGYERQSRRKSAGLRTNVLVCLGSCLIMVMSVEMYQEVEGKTNADPARLAAQVVVMTTVSLTLSVLPVRQNLLMVPTP